MKTSASPLALVLALCALCTLGGCNGQESPSAAPTSRSEAEPFTTWFDLEVGGVPTRVQLAISERERNRGLMFRNELGEDDGMLFVFEEPQPLSFWMKNTPLPLHIAYIDAEGVIREIYPLSPFKTDSVYSMREDLQFALEMNRGWFADNGVREGDAIDLEAVAAAMRARGFDPAEYGLE